MLLLLLYIAINIGLFAILMRNIKDIYHLSIYSDTFVSIRNGKFN